QKAGGRSQTSEVGSQKPEGRHPPSATATRKSQIANRKWDWLRSVSAIVVVCLVVCGWHYGRVWARFGKPIVGNWDALSGQEGQGQWWLEPGFGTSAFYFHFGRALI